MPDSVLAFQDVTMRFAGTDRTVLNGLTFELPSGKSIALAGRSGSGKSTLLHLAAGIALPSSGQVILDGIDLSTAAEKTRTAVRGRAVGLVFQFFHLLPHLSVGENVALPGWVAGLDRQTLQPRVDELLRRVDLMDRRDDSVAKLSGGEMQRVAICRALLRSPRLILADEPTGSLDDRTGGQVMDLLHELVREEGGTLLYVTHSREIAALADVVWQLHDGMLSQGPPS